MNNFGGFFKSSSPGERTQSISIENQRKGSMNEALNRNTHVPSKFKKEATMRSKSEERKTMVDNHKGD